MNKEYEGKEKDEFKKMVETLDASDEKLMIQIYYFTDICKQQPNVAFKIRNIHKYKSYLATIFRST